jgi:ATP/maltotriose-dependent transcriptional regulator MalT
MGDRETVVMGRAAYDRRRWGEAYDRLSAGAEDQELAVDDLERLAVAAYMTGRTEAAAETLERLHLALLDAGEVSPAVRWAVWLAILLFQAGQHAQAGGWVSRARRLLADTSEDGPERGYLLVPAALQALDGGDLEHARELFQQAAAIAERCQEADLTVMGVLGQGQALVAMGEAETGVAMLDEAMIAVTTDDVSPLMAGIAYCAMIIACRAVFDVRRAQEWTAALSLWCSSQQDLHPYRGQCLVHRSEIMQLRGEWSEAMDEVEQACAHLSAAPGDPVIGMAHYQRAELLRLRGQLLQAEQSYREASRWGHPPEPGLSLLRLAQGRVEDGVAAMRRESLAAEGDRVRRSRILAALVEVLLAAGDAEGAAAAVDELEALAADVDSVYLDAAAAEGRGSLLLATGEPLPACGVLRRAWRGWQQLDAPYDAARVRLLMAQACRRLDDHDTADMELDAARRVFEQLGAAPALERARELSRTPETGPPGGLTPREVDVLELVATGATNRQIADALVLSEKTVARHLSNMFTKLDIGSRSAATAWAYEHGLA